MNTRQLWRAGAEQLKAAGVPDPEYDSGMLLSHVTGRPHLTLRLGQEDASPREEAAFRRLLARRADREPLQYLMGTAFFRGMELRVRPGVLIPRPETEALAGWAMEWAKGREDPCFLDLCCGSGCLGLSLKREMPECRVVLTDISSEAVALSRENRDLLGLECEIRQGDLLAPVAGETFDCIVTNPPYIPAGECGTLQPEVMREPRLALDGGADGLDFYRRILREGPACLKPGGAILMEGGYGQAEEICRLAASALRTEIRQDEAGIGRMILAEYP